MTEYPDKLEVAFLAHSAVLAAMAPKSASGTGSDKSAPGQWFSRDVEQDRAYNLMRALRHGSTYWNLKQGTEVDPNGETARDHLIRMITRAAMELAVYDNEQIGK